MSGEVERDMEALAVALDDLVMSKGVALDEVRLDWLTDWIAERVEAARREGATEALTEAAAEGSGVVHVAGLPLDAVAVSWLRDRAAAIREDS